MKSLEFDLVVIDEAGQATEAETYCPVSLCKTDGTGSLFIYLFIYHFLYIHITTLCENTQY